MPDRKKMPSARMLRRLIDYNQETGALHWKQRPVWMFKAGHIDRKSMARMWNDRYAGKAAFTAISGPGYAVGRILDSSYPAHRIIWRMEIGDCPEFIDHINGDRTDNRIENLRVVTRMENHQNMARFKTNTSGVTGVTWSRAARKWQASIRHQYTKIYLGLFESLEEAAAARKSAERKYGFHPNHGRGA